MKIEELKKLEKYGNPVEEKDGTLVYLTQDAYIGETDETYHATGIDANDNKYIITWATYDSWRGHKVKDNGDCCKCDGPCNNIDESDACDWDDPIRVKKI